MDVAKALIRSVTRAFYDTKHVLVVDALMIHSALPNEDLALLLGIQQKDLRKLCGKLREDRLLTVHSRPEIRDGMTRPINKEYYYIDFHATIDAIKYRIYKLTEKVKEMYKVSTEKKDYACPQCHAQWTQLEVLDKVGPMGFECHRCGGLLERQEEKEGEATGHEKQSKLMSQLDDFLRMLRKIDSQDVPNNDFETALRHALPVKRNQTMNPLRPYQPVNKSSTSGRYSTQNVAVPLDVSVTSSSERTAAEQAEEAKRKAEILAQNALPVWHTKSTITGEPSKETSGDQDGSFSNGNLFIKEDEDEKKNVSVLDDELAAYYDQLAQEKAKEAREDREADESSEDEEGEEEEFEDVGASPADKDKSLVSADNANKSPRKTNGKVSESESSAPATGVSTPAQPGTAETRSISNDDEPVAKRVKFEDVDKSPVEAMRNSNADDKESEEDDLEFEDV